MKYLKLFTSHSDYNAAKSSLDKPNVSHCVAENEVHYNPKSHDYSKDYFTFVALEDGTFQLSVNTINYSIDNGTTWVTLAANTATPTITAGNKIIWKGELTPTSDNGIGTFTSTGKFDAEGNVMSLLFGDNFRNQIDLTGKRYAFIKLFLSNNNLINAQNLLLPATTLVSDCYKYMFESCSSLITAPKLPATTAPYKCYTNMFRRCTSLTVAPELPATTLGNNCYYLMFQECPITTITLPALNLAPNCYNYMFHGCSNLNYVKAMFTTTPSTTYTDSWVDGVSATGTFVKNAAAQWDVSGVNGIPTGWTVQTASK